jgi:hypothetical protein
MKFFRAGTLVAVNVRMRALMLAFMIRQIA